MSEYRGVPMHADVVGRTRVDEEYGAGWKDGVDAALRTAAGGVRVPADLQPDIPFRPWDSVPLSVTDQDAVRAFTAVIQDNPAEALKIVERMSPRDRAVLAFYLKEMGHIIDTVEGMRIYG